MKRNSLVLAALSLALPLDSAQAAIETIVVTATRSSHELDRLAGSIATVGREELELIAPVHITEALARTPGVWISRGNGQEHLTAIRSPVFTGPGSCGSFYMAEDGVPLRPAGFCNVNQLFEVDAAQAGRIEVLRGPGTAVHGGTALHGVINVVSRAPAGAGAAGELAVEGGPHDYARLRTGLEGGTRGNAWRAYATLAHDGGYKDDSGYEDYKLGWRHDLEGTDWAFTSLLSATKLQQETAGYVEGEESYRDNHLRRTNPNPEAFRDNTALRWQGRLTHHYAPDRYWTFTPYARYQTMRFRQHFLPGIPLEENGATSAGWQAAHYWQPGTAWSAIAGLDGEWARGALEQFQPESFVNPTFPQGWQYDYTVRGLNSALFGRVTWQVAPGLQLEAGARLEHQRYDYSNDLPVGAVTESGEPCRRNGAVIPCRYARPADRRDRFTDEAFDLGAIWSLSASQSLHARLARGFRPPQAAELYRLQETQQAADLESERADSVELGWRGDWEAISHELTLYYMDKRDVIFQDTQRRNVTGADSEHMGAEYGLTWQFAEQWQLATSGSWSRHRYTANVELSGLPAGVSIDGNDMVAAPRTLASTRLVWNSPGHGTWELEWLHIGSYYLEPTNSAKYPGHDLLNLRWRQQITPRFHLAARLLNVTDRDYAERADYAFGNYRYFVGEPRALYVEAGWRF